MWKLLAMLCCAAGSAAADDWDHDANIDAAVAELVSSYKAEGHTGMQRVVNDCYDKIVKNDAFDDQLKRLEFCAGMDFAGFEIDQRTRETEKQVKTAFFSAANVRQRVFRLEEYLPDPNAGNQVLRAWASRASDALIRLAP